MYVPFGKSVGDVTFRFSLRHHFWPRMKKTMEHNPQLVDVCQLYNTDSYWLFWGNIVQ